MFNLMNPHMVQPRFIEKREDREFGHLGPGSYLGTSTDSHLDRQIRYKQAAVRSRSQQPTKFMEKDTGKIIEVGSSR